MPDVATLKILKVRAGGKGRLQRHRRKDEAGFIYSGTMIVRWLQGEQLHSRFLAAGDSYHFPPGCFHQEEAVTDCTVLEVSTPYGNDREGAETLLGLPVDENALPDTTEDEVTTVERWW